MLRILKEVVVGAYLQKVAHVRQHQIHMQVHVHIAKVHIIVDVPAGCIAAHRNRCLRASESEISSWLRVLMCVLGLEVLLLGNQQPSELALGMLQKQFGVAAILHDQVMQQNEQFDAYCCRLPIV